MKSRWQNLSGIQKELLLFVCLPTILVFLYCALYASPMYISETKFAVRSGTEQPMSLDIATQFLKSSNSSVQDAEIVEAYIRSTDIFTALDEKLKVIDHFSDSRWDWPSRLTTSPTLWDKDSFWNRISKPVVNPDNGIVTYTVRAYEPKMAQAIAEEVLHQSEELVNEMNERAHKDTVLLAEEEVKLAQKRVQNAQKALEAFRNEHADLDPQATATDDRDGTGRPTHAASCRNCQRRNLYEGNGAEAPGNEGTAQSSGKAACRGKGSFGREGCGCGNLQHLGFAV